MPIAIGIIILQIACVIHLVKTGRNTLWLSAIIFLPLVGTIAYFIVEVLPRAAINQQVRAVQAKASAALDPEREMRAARDALDLADTVANRLRLADALAGLGRWADAIPYYRESIRMTVGDADPRSQSKLAAALYETGQSDEALALLDGVGPLAGQSETDRHNLLRAKIYEHLGRKEEALALYADLVLRMPGEEARCRYAALLIDRGREHKAVKVLEEVESRMKRLSRGQRLAEAEMYRWASETLARLRKAT